LEIVVAEPVHPANSIKALKDETSVKQFIKILQKEHK